MSCKQLLLFLSLRVTVKNSRLHANGMAIIVVKTICQHDCFNSLAQALRNSRALRKGSIHSLYCYNQLNSLTKKTSEANWRHSVLPSVLLHNLRHNV